MGLLLGYMQLEKLSSNFVGRIRSCEFIDDILAINGKGNLKRKFRTLWKLDGIAAILCIICNLDSSLRTIQRKGDLALFFLLPI
jgi:hypothetical protein